ncbi:variant-type mycofactocin precursor [Desulfobacula sp.]|nr:variant-type mycofactocin precursor [Desulfobacula sp.]
MKEQDNQMNDIKADIEKTEDIFDTEEIEIEEMAIDGICGVY